MDYFDFHIDFENRNTAFMSITIDTVLSAVAAIAIVSFCFWKPNFPQNILPKIGVQNDKIVGFFLGFYWISIPVIIYCLMTMMWQ